MTTAVLLDRRSPSTALCSSRPFTPPFCSARRPLRLSTPLTMSALRPSRSENTRPRVRDSDLRLRRVLHDPKLQVMSGANYDRDPKTCRATVFTQTDPLPLGAGSAFESAYVYGLNNPLVYIDPTGLRGQVAGRSNVKVLGCQVTNAGGVIITTGCGTGGRVTTPVDPGDKPKPKPGTGTKIGLGAAAAAAIAKCIESGLCNPDGSPKRGPRGGGAPPTTLPKTLNGGCPEEDPEPLEDDTVVVRGGLNGPENSARFGG